MHENRETSETPAGKPDGRSAGEGSGRTARVYVCEESHSGVLPMNHSNKDTRLSAESGEGRPLIKENAGQSNTYPTQSGKGVSQGLAGVRKAAREHKEMKFTALLHHLTVDLLRESFYSLKRKAAPGVDGVTWQEYASGLEDRLVDLHGRVHRGAYRALPSRRVYIQKEDGRQRPLGVAALEDKIVQQAVVTILNQIYEEDFLGFSYGFRPGRSQHDALDALSYALLKKKVNYILDADIRGFFDNLDKSWMIQFMEHRVADPRILRLIRKWLKAGVMEEGQWSEPQTGTPQGSVVSPLLSNVYLHYSFDLWVNVWRQKWAQGEVVVIRYADDTILGFQYQTDADRFLENLRERLAKFGLELHPDKTRRIEFGRFAEENRKRRGEGKPETFDFLGFTHISGKNVSGASWFVAKRSANAYEASCERSNSSFGCACTIRCPKPEDGCSRSSKATSTTTRYRETSQVWGRSVTGCWRYGGVLSAAGARNTGSRGRGLWPWLSAGSRNRARFIPFQMHALPPFICDKNRMR